MGTVAQTVLPFKLEATEEMLTANAGLALFGEFMRGLGLHRWLAQEMPKPGSGRGYEAATYIAPLALMLTGGGRSLEDLRTLKNDAALATLLKQETLPSTDAVGDWLRRMGAGTGLAGLSRINQRTITTRLRQTGITRHTLDCDASQIVAEKEAAHTTYKGCQGYMPMIGHLAEASVIIHDEFREGNIAPATQNLEFIKACEACLPKGHTIPHNLFVLFKHSVLGEGWHRNKVVTVRWRLFHLPGKLVRHAGAWVLKIEKSALDLFQAIREKSFKLAVSNST